jgi:hypothetical protein
MSSSTSYAGVDTDSEDEWQLIDGPSQTSASKKRTSSSLSGAARLMTNPGKKSRTDFRKLFGGRQAPQAKEVEEDALHSVFLFTDGMPTSGISDTASLVRTLDKMLSKAPKTRVYTFGFGSDHNPNLLHQLAEVGSGTYYFVEKEENIPTAFADALGGLLSVAAQNVRMEFHPLPGVKISNVYASYPQTDQENGGKNLQIGDLFSEEGKDLLFDLDLPEILPTDEFVDFQLGMIKVTYLDCQAGAVRTLEVPCTVKRTSEVPADAKTNFDVSSQRARFETALVLEEAKQEADTGDLESARNRLRKQAENVRTLSARSPDLSCSSMMQQLALDLEEAEYNMSDQSMYLSKGKMWMTSKSHEHSFQRSACLSDDEDENGASYGASAEYSPCPPSPWTSVHSYANKTQKSMRKLAAQTPKSL